MRVAPQEDEAEPAAALPVLVALRCTHDLDETAAQALADCLDAEERRQAARFAFAEDRRDYLVAHVLLRHALSALEPCDPAAWVFARGPGGKPCLAGGGTLEFNLSHTRGWAACAVARGSAVGLDVERVRTDPDLPALARAHFSAEECVALERSGVTAQAARFAELWSLKEAYAKGLGTGIGEGLPAVSFRLAAGGALECLDAGKALRRWQFALCALPDARLALAACAPVGGRIRMRVRTLDAARSASASGLRLLHASTGLTLEPG
ncbi:MAG: 4'-phosphopantetheinyl transferase superfamily protein [Burkholderiales bacterium]|nr:4'-phosphopantetheinyl transferase superfamily protein [Burkholderiales bacterium]